MSPTSPHSLSTPPGATHPLPSSFFSYLHLSLHPPQPLDLLTTRTYLTSALTRFLGLTGAAIPIDILHLEHSSCWIRVPREDATAVLAAVGGWVGGAGEGKVGWRLRGWSDWLGALVGARGERSLWEDEETDGDK